MAKETKWVFNANQKEATENNGRRDSVSVRGKKSSKLKGLGSKVKGGIKGLGSAMKDYFTNPETLSDFLISLGLVVAVIFIYLAFGGYIPNISITNYWAFVITAILIAVRIAWDIGEKATRVDLRKALPRNRLILIIVQRLVIGWSLIMGANIVYGFGMWVWIGIVSNGLADVLISIDTMLIATVFMVLFHAYVNKDKRKPKSTLERRREGRKPTQKRSVSIRESIENFWGLFFVAGTIVLLIVMFHLYFVKIAGSSELSAILMGTYNQPPTYFAGATEVEDWFGYVFYILFNRNTPQFMVAMMGFGAIGMMLLNNQGVFGKNATQAITAIIGIVPMILVILTLFGTIEPPDKLISVIGLPVTIAQFIYALGLILTYVVAFSIMSVFISSTRAINLDMDN